MSDIETFEQARSRLGAKAVHALMELAMLLEQQRHGAAAAQQLHDQVDTGDTVLEFALRMEATSASIVGMERRGTSARGVVDVLLFASPGAPPARPQGEVTGSDHVELEPAPPTLRESVSGLVAAAYAAVQTQDPKGAQGLYVRTKRGAELQFTVSIASTTNTQTRARVVGVERGPDSLRPLLDEEMVWSLPPGAEPT